MNLISQRLTPVFRIFVLFILSASCYLLLTTATYAHILKTDGDIGIVLHIDPDDDPPVGNNSTIIFDLKDKSNKFNPQNCNCQIIVLEKGRVIYQSPMYSPSATSLTAVHLLVFPQKDMYQIQATGKPVTAGAFQPFNINFDIRVEKEDLGQNKVNNQPFGFASHKIYLLILGLIMVSLIGCLAAKKFLRKN